MGLLTALEAHSQFCCGRALQKPRVFGNFSFWANSMRMSRIFIALTALLCSHLTTQAQVLDKQQQLNAQTFWVNRDWTWYQQNIPFFECPDAEITTTWYYRWELLTRHLTYGSPNSGYSFTEFIDRPFWSGAYGAISCPAGHQLYEARWLRSPLVANDYSRYWFRTPGAQPRNYSTWLADSVWAVHEVHPDAAFAVDLLPDLIRNYEGWESRQFSPEVGLFWQTGHDDGMEFNINSRQTKDILRGAPGYRPSFNAYMWADAEAIARLARLDGQNALAEVWQKKADALKEKIQSLLWDERRGFFLPMYRDDEEREGHKVRRLTRTYESGEFAGNEHGRELIGYVPWQFGLPATDRGYEHAWKYLMDPNYFAAKYGPSTVERHDPMFLLQKWCCWWSGQSWPYATTQTLKALANVLQNPAYRNSDSKLPVSAADYVSLLQTYARSHRKEGRPYLAEALHPDTGSFEGHDGYNHSEHYFHSGFCDLVITGLVGLKPSTGNTLEIVPLASPDWAWFALDDVPYHHQRLSILWDRDGTRYGRGKGLFVLANGAVVAQADRLQPLTVTLPTAASPVPSAMEAQAIAVNFAVNNEGDYYPRLTAGSVQSGTSPAKLIDGNAWYDQHPPNRWLAEDSAGPEDTLELDMGTARPVHSLRLMFLEDEPAILPPRQCQIFHRVLPDAEWVPLQARPSHEIPAGRTANTWTFDEMPVRQLKIVMTRGDHGKPGLTELEVWGNAIRPITPPPAPEGTLAAGRKNMEYPKMSASHTSRYDRLEMANDGRSVFAASPHNRWTCYESPNTSDWLEVDFGKAETVSRVELLIYDDGGGVQAPKAITIEWFDGTRWKPVDLKRANPEKPTGGISNSLLFQPVSTTRLRAVFEHKGAARSGVTEMEVWAQ